MKKVSKKTSVSLKKILIYSFGAAIIVSIGVFLVLNYSNFTQAQTVVISEVYLKTPDTSN